MAMNYGEALEKLKEYGQEHVLGFYDRLSDNGKRELLCQIEDTDFGMIRSAGKGGARGKITPIEAMTLEAIEDKREQFAAVGKKVICEGKVGAVLLAGGMGTRLGSDAPKGTYNIGETKDVYIFECIIHNLMDVVNETGSLIQLFIMTSDKNNDATVAFFKEHDYFGYDSRYIAFFKQDMAPATDYDGKVYMEDMGHISTSPNGNGGWFSSMRKSGMLDIVSKRGIEWLNVFAVDNVLQRIADPVFVGAVISGGYGVGSKVIRKVTPEEKVGVMCLEDNRPSIVEYYELSEEMRYEKNERGEYAYNFGVILNYIFKVGELEDILERRLPYHVAEKKISHIDDNGKPVQSDEPNGYKYEQFILDMIKMMDGCLPFEVVREKEFAPIKNKTGADSVDTARELLKRNGVNL